MKVKTRFEKESAPSSTEFETPEYLQRRTTIEKQYPDFASNIPTYRTGQ